MNFENNSAEISETKRLNALKAYNILDTLTEKDYDDITLMASIICDVPIALISFVDDERQWFKSNLGLKIKSTLREHSFCNHAIQSPTDPLIVEDSRKDDRFKNNPLVIGDPNVVFYAGIPIVTEDGFGLGTVCIIDNKPRKLTNNQVTALKMLSNQAMNLLQLRKVNQDLNDVQLSLEVQNKKLDEYNKGLELIIERNLSDRTKEIAAQNVVLEKMNIELQAFNYISSHDLQEPLRKIQFFCSIIIDKELHLLSDKGKDYLQRISKASDRMRVLIKDLLAYSRTTTSEKKYEIVALKSLVENVEYDLQEEIKDKNAQIEILDNVDITVIPFQFRQLIYNLISNALKFSKLGVSPHITISCVLETNPSGEKVFLETNKNYFCLKIADNGIGFNNKYGDKIFELFQRLGTTDIKMGTGIGLAIVKKIIDNHDGLIQVESHEGIGTTFCIYIPEVITAFQKSKNSFLKNSSKIFN